jgi:hypothetical protein
MFLQTDGNLERIKQLDQSLKSAAAAAATPGTTKSSEGGVFSFKLKDEGIKYKDSRSVSTGHFLSHGSRWQVYR